MLFVGVDGGGSTCRVRVRDASGRVRASAVGGPANVYLDFDAALRTVAATVATALDDAGADETPARLGLGLAGVSSPAVAARVRDALTGFAAVSVTHDGDIACLGAHAGADGGLIIAGTGSGAVARIQGRILTIGGRGFILGDEGSGARLGLEAVRAALRAYDGLEVETALTRRLMAHFTDDPVAAIAWARHAPSSAFAAFAPLVTAAAEAGDAVAVALVQAAADAIAVLAKVLKAQGVLQLCLAGGLAPSLHHFLPEPLRESLQPPLLDALDGALLLAGCPLLAPLAPAVAPSR